jgi:hypothetical protein
MDGTRDVSPALWLARGELPPTGMSDDAEVGVNFAVDDIAQQICDLIVEINAERFTSETDS